MFDPTASAAGTARTATPPIRPHDHRGAAREPRSAASAPAISPRGVALWACGEGLRAGDAVVLLVRNLGQAEALRLGLVRVGVRAVCLDPSARGADLADALTASGAVLAVVDTALAAAYGTVMGRLAAYPAVWWNGPGADFASLDRALSELA